MEFRKGQAAMEYLMTYGWAILVIVIVLAALLYLGVFNVRPPEICTFSPGITCKTFYLKAAKVNLTLTNGLQKPITITNATCTQQSDVGAMTWSPAFAPVLAVGVGGDAIVPAVDCRNGVGTPYTAAELPAGAGYSGKVCISYYFTAEGVTMPRIICGTGYFISA